MRDVELKLMKMAVRILNSKNGRVKHGPEKMLMILDL